MARINIEDSIWSDPRFLKLCVKVGDQFKAVGLAVMAWRLAQEFWCPEKKLIPKKRWTESDLPDLLFECGLAEMQGDDIYVRGTAENFEWYFERLKAAKKGGEASAERRKSKSNQRSTKRQPNVEQTSTGVKQIQPSSSSSSSSSFSFSEEKKNKNTFLTESVAQPPQASDCLPAVQPPKHSKFSDATRAKMQAFIAAYAEGYRKKYGGAPEGIRDKGVIGKLGHWIESVSQDRAVNLVEVYLQVDYWQINNACHDLWQFFRNLNRIGIALDSGQAATGIDWSKVFA